MRNALLENIENKTWIYHPNEEEGVQRLCKRNRRLEKEYQQKRIEGWKKQKKREQEIDDWKQNR